MAIAAHANTDKYAEIQKYLNALGYNVGAVDGIIGKNSKRQLNQALADYGYLFDGNADETELTILRKIAQENSVVVSNRMFGATRLNLEKIMDEQTANLFQASHPANIIDPILADNHILTV